MFVLFYLLHVVSFCMQLHLVISLAEQRDSGEACGTGFARRRVYCISGVEMWKYPKPDFSLL